METEVAQPCDNNVRPPSQRPKRKKRKNFVANAKKYAKKGQMGRGSRVPEELFQYLIGILDSMRAGLSDEDQRRALVDNVLERTQGEELNIVGNQVGCRVVELLLPYSSETDLERYMDILFPELRRLCSDNFSSHVVETVLRVACDRATLHLQGEQQEEDVTPNKKPKLENKCEQYTKKHIKVCYEYTLKMCRYALNNLEDFVWDSYANHILRSALKSLSGITLLPGEKPKVNMFRETVRENKGIPPHQTSMSYRETPQEYKDMVKEFVERLSAWPQFKDMPYQNVTSALLQVLLFAIKNVDKNMTKTLVKKLLNESFIPENWNPARTDEDKKDVCKLELEDDTPKHNKKLPPALQQESSVRVVEAALFVCRRKLYTQLLARLFLGRLPHLVSAPVLNFTVQRLFDNCTVKEELELMFSEVCDQWPSVLSSGNSGVLVAVAKACLRLGTRQAHFVTSLESALQCPPGGSDGLFPLRCLKLCGQSELADSPGFIHVHGSVLLQTMLHFQRPGTIVTGILCWPAALLGAVLSDVKGSHVADALYSAPFVGGKARDKIGRKLQGQYRQLAVSQYGSRAFEQIFEHVTVERRADMMSELAAKSGLLQGSASGRALVTKLQLELYKKSPDRWCATMKHKESGQPRVDILNVTY